MKLPAIKIKPLSAMFVIPIALGALAYSQTAPTGPRIKTDPEIFDFGFVPQGATVSHTFWLKNSGTELVQIQKLVPNCGCTQVPPTDSTIAVGDSIPAEILFGTRNMSWKVEKFTRIQSNAKGRVPALTIRAFVLAQDSNSAVMTAAPEIVTIAAGETKNVRLKNVTKNALTIRVVDYPFGFIQLNSKEMALGSGETKSLTVLLPSTAETANFSKSLTLQADDHAKTRITIPIEGRGREAEQDG